MAPKSSSGKEKLIGDEEEVLQAVILADSFNKRFKPLTSRKPRCLLPICNAPLLDWTFESLSLAGVQEIFVICRSHADQVKTAIANSKWSSPSSGLKIVPIITAKETFSPGDAMRDIYTHGIITSDFVLVTGDLVSSVRIDEVVRAHKERRKTNKDAIMTMVVKPSGARHRTRSRGESAVFVLDPETSECLHYESTNGYPPTKVVRIPREILAEHPEIEIRNDLIDCQIDVCSVEVPSLFQDNFDYQDLRRDFVHGVLTSDLLMKNIHCYVLKDGYAARVKDTKSYDSISKDILGRWAFPLVPDDNHPGGHNYEYLRGNKYLARDNTVELSRTCKVGPNTLIGSRTLIFDNVQVSSSVIGQHCQIGKGSIIRGSYLFDGVTVGDECTVENSIVGVGVIIKEGSHVPRGCLIGDEVVLGPKARLTPFDKVSKRWEKKVPAQDVDADAEFESEDESDMEEVEEGHTITVLGDTSNAFLMREPGESEDEDLPEDETWANRRLGRIGDDCSDLELSDDGSVSDDGESDSDESEDETSSNAFTKSLHMLDASSTSSLPSSSMLLSSTAADDHASKEFQAEVHASLERAFAEDHSIDNAAVELKTLRMASNVPLVRVREAVVQAVVEHIPLVSHPPAEQRKEIHRVITRWGGLIDQIGGADAVETVTVLQTYCAHTEDLERRALFGQVLASLYQEDVVDEEDIRKWHGMKESRGGGEGMKHCWLVGGKMLAQFDAQSSGEEESDEEDAKPTSKPAAKQPAEASDDEEEEEEEDDDSQPIAGSSPVEISVSDLAEPVKPSTINPDQDDVLPPVPSTLLSEPPPIQRGSSTATLTPVTISRSPLSDNAAAASSSEDDDETGSESSEVTSSSVEMDATRDTPKLPPGEDSETEAAADILAGSMATLRIGEAGPGPSSAKLAPSLSRDGARKEEDEEDKGAESDSTVATSDDEGEDAAQKQRDRSGTIRASAPVQVPATAVVPVAAQTAASASVPASAPAPAAPVSRLTAQLLRGADSFDTLSASSTSNSHSTEGSEGSSEHDHDTDDAASSSAASTTSEEESSEAGTSTTGSEADEEE